MTTVDGHLAQYEDFMKAANNEDDPPPARVEALFLATYHLIDAYAAHKGVHINKHQRVRPELKRNPAIFGEATEEVWMTFQDIERWHIKALFSFYLRPRAIIRMIRDVGFFGLIGMGLSTLLNLMCYTFRKK